MAAQSAFAELTTSLPMKPQPTLLAMSAGLAFLSFVATGCGTVRAGYESAPYQAVRTTGKFEVRDYPALTVVETPMKTGHNGEDGSFSRLFRYISGGNEAEEKIAMTTPVFMSGDATNAAMSFVMPAKMKTADVPRPNDAQVRVRELPAGRFAVLRFSGGRNAANEAEALSKLRAWMETEGLKEVSPPVFAYFDPPWTPAFLRRNEVMTRIEFSPQPRLATRPVFMLH
jgi:DNA gyrase inhibitor GyrI